MAQAWMVMGETYLLTIVRSFRCFPPMVTTSLRRYCV